MVPSKVHSIVQLERILFRNAFVKSITRGCCSTIHHSPLRNVLSQYCPSQLEKHCMDGRCGGILKAGWPSFQNRNVLLNLTNCTVRWYRSTSTLLTPTNAPSNTENSSSILSRRQVAALEEYLYESVGNVVKDPMVGKTINELKWMNKRIATSHRGDDGVIFVDMLLKLPSLLHPSLPELKNKCREVAQANAEEWFSHEKVDVKTVVVNVEALPGKPVSAMSKLLEDPNELLSNLGPGLASVSHIVAVYSCKGGVGKSTIAVNLAYELNAKGGRVGLLDLDLYGPSLPLLVQPVDKTIRRSTLGAGMVYPIEHQGVKIMSLGFVNQMSGVPGSGENNGAAIMKGPMAVKVATQLLKSTDWGDLDILLLDLPPGTGDVQLAVLQELQLTGAIAVTTPSRLAVADTLKGIEMFTSLGVPTIAVVENMSFFEDETGKRHYPFGVGIPEQDNNETNTKHKKQFTSKNLIKLPISIATTDANETSNPLTLCRPEVGAKNELIAYNQLGNIVCQQLLNNDFGSDVYGKEIVHFGDDNHEFDIASVVLSLESKKDPPTGERKFIVRIFSETGAKEIQVLPSVFRASDPRTGDLIPDSPFLINLEIESRATSQAPDPMVETTKIRTKKSPSIVPSSVSRRGRYGFQVVWQDGATIIYSNLCIVKCAGGKLPSVEEST